jgi:hypothetical protein
MSKPKWLSLDEITADPEIQSRAVIREATVEEYAAALQEKAVFPPVTCVSEGKTIWLADGFHRLAAHRKAGKTKILAEVQKGTKREAILVAAGANDTHGLRRSVEDKRHVVLRFLNDPTWVKRADRWIARTCKVSADLVGDMRRWHLSAATDSQPMTREVRRGGVTYEQSWKPRMPQMIDKHSGPELLARTPDMRMPEATGSDTKREPQPRTPHTVLSVAELPTDRYTFSQPGPIGELKAQRLTDTTLRPAGASRPAEEQVLRLIDDLDDRLTIQGYEKISEVALNRAAFKRLKKRSKK